MRKGMLCRLLLFLFALSLTTYSCRKSFLTEIQEVELKNAPPEVSDLDTIKLATGFGSFDLDLSSIISDREGDDIIITAVSENTDVVTASVNGLVLTLSEISEGNSTVLLTVDDGVDRDQLVQTSFVVVISEQTVFYKFLMDLSRIPNGTEFDEYTLEDGTQIGRVEASSGSSRVVQNGVLEWTTDEWDVMSITFPTPIDLTSDATFRFEYANLFSDHFGVTVIDANGGEVGFGWDEAPFAGNMILNSSSFNTFEFDLSEYTGTGVDLSAVTAVYLEKFGATQSQSFKLKNLAIGLK